MSKDEWREKAIAFLNAREFPKGYCHMKRRNPSGGMPKEFGVIYPSNLCQVVILDENMVPIEKKTQDFQSLDDMFEAGWDVD